jgi:uncharacterized SAM-binding protein YcdF (DUF218 family)
VILRLTALVALLYALGFALFAVTLGDPAPASRTDAIVVLTGGPGRIDRGIGLLEDGQARRMLIAGANPAVAKRDLIRLTGAQRRLFDCCIDLGTESVDTRSNAEEAQRWLKRHRFRSLRLVTSDWHMRRARYEFERQLGGDYRIVPDAVRTQPSLTILFGEYSKYVLRRLSVWLDL